MLGEVRSQVGKQGGRNRNKHTWERRPIRRVVRFGAQVDRYIYKYL